MLHPGHRHAREPRDRRDRDSSLDAVGEHHLGIVAAQHLPEAYAGPQEVGPAGAGLDDLDGHAGLREARVQRTVLQQHDPGVEPVGGGENREEPSLRAAQRRVRGHDRHRQRGGHLVVSLLRAYASDASDASDAPGSVAATRAPAVARRRAKPPATLAEAAARPTTNHRVVLVIGLRRG